MAKIMTSGEYPAYKLKPSMQRMMMPKTILLVVLAGLFYIGLYTNLKLIGYKIEPLINTSILLGIFILVAFDLLYEFKKAYGIEYYFYREKLCASGLCINYVSIANIEVRRDTLDKIARTCSLVINAKVVLSCVPDSYNLYQYIQNSMRIAKSASVPMTMPTSNAMR